jgi:hypothetical protein
MVRILWKKGNSMENQALCSRIENGTVTEEETERMGETFMKLDDMMKQLRDIFHLKENDLNEHNESEAA